jgi:purine-binding chemotaxis protein CheW
MAETAQYLTLGLDGETFGISIRNVREILDMRPISRLPHAPHFLLGMIDVRSSTSGSNSICRACRRPTPPASSSLT